MHIYVKNIAAKPLPDPIWNDGVLIGRLFWWGRPIQEEAQERQ